MSASTEATLAWVNQLHSSADSLTTKDLSKFYSTNAVLRYGNIEEAKGVEEITKFFEAVFPLLKLMKHELVEMDRIGNKVYESCFITYIVANDPEEKKIKIPAFGKIFLVEEGKEEAGKMERFEVFLDPSEVFARIQELTKKG
ncbi:Cystinosin protein [Rutstroemia sp. NJR-2017a WRK4]|nr:Cystinosin protein [Rutstroemia sp. NJR-2017a WRK4]PQE11894.1 Cystinosin protein [Rutstroemia sp. NJR-2017a WRK4]